MSYAHWCAVVLATFACARLAHAAPPPPPNVRLTAIEDAYVVASAPATSFGSEPVVETGGSRRTVPSEARRTL
jgi:hypothetical protein